MSVSLDLEHIMKIHSLFLAVLLGAWGCNNQQPANNATENGSANPAENTTSSNQPASKQSEETDNPEIVAPEKPAVKVTHVISGEEVYYLDGPQQMRPPDGKFPAGTRVELVQDSGSYSMVVSEDGIRAYVSTGALKPIE
jgi:hypothetical protein